jgi:nucleoside-diphosphate-sugar epimerase
MKFIITGGAGFVGRWFSLQLLRDGHSVTVVDNLVNGGGGINPTKEKWFIGDPTTFPGFEWLNEDCREFFKRYSEEVDVVIHLAAVVGGRLTIELNPLAVAEDLEIDSAFWRWISKVKPRHVIHFSSSAAYPIQLQTKDDMKFLAESDLSLMNIQGIPDLTYGWAKLTSEFVSRVASNQFGVKVATYRPFSGYGEDQDLSYPFPSIAKRAVDAMNSEQDYFQIWGSGKQSRDFIHISDVVRLVLSSYEKLDALTPINLGTGVGTSFFQLAEYALEICKLDLPIKNQSDKPEGVFFRVADTSQMKKFGLKPTISVRDGMSRAISYWATRVS